MLWLFVDHVLNDTLSVKFYTRFVFSTEERHIGDSQLEIQLWN